MNLTDEQKLIMTESVKIYLVPEQRMGKVYKVTPEMITLNIGTKKEPQHIKFTPSELESKIYKDEIVLQKRVIWGKNGQYAGVKPLDNPPIKDVYAPVKKAQDIIKKNGGIPDAREISTPPEVGYLNLKTKRFSLTPKKGYVRIEYREVKTQRVSLDLTDEQIKLLEEMGIKG